jgi:hypothetical protein
LAIGGFASAGSGIVETIGIGVTAGEMGAGSGIAIGLKLAYQQQLPYSDRQSDS